jgi:protoheme IX farnesyltransferase
VSVSSWKQGWRDFSALVKLRLSLTVVLSSVLAYLVALPAGQFTWWSLFVLSAGGFFTTAAANVINEVSEKDYDSQMERTKDRPIASGRLSSSEALLYAGFLCLFGISFLALFNPWAAFLGTVSLVSYAYVYTPLKRIGPEAVLVGAIPGALPALIGCAAAEGYISSLGLTLFVMQFFWQLPHFYAIGYLGYPDYKKAGFKLVAEKNGEVDSAKLGRDAWVASIILVPLSFVPFLLDEVSLVAAALVGIIGLVFSQFAWKFWQQPDRGTALKMMFASFGYIPLAFLIFWLDQIL